MARTLRYSGCSAAETTICLRPVRRVAISAASAVAVAPSYMDAFDTSMPVSRHTKVCHSNSACSVPCETSGWYGVYAVKNSLRSSSWSTAGGTWCG